MPLSAPWLNPSVQCIKELGRGGATVAGRVQENSFSPRKSSVGQRKEFDKYWAFKWSKEEWII